MMKRLSYVQSFTHKSCLAISLLCLTAACGARRDGGGGVSGLPASDQQIAAPLPDPQAGTAPDHGPNRSPDPRTDPRADVPPSPTPQVGATQPPVKINYHIEISPLWEGHSSEAEEWTQHAFRVIDRYGSHLVAGTSDVAGFCPSYATLTRNQKINFWVFFVSAIARYESAFDPTNRSLESSMGIDPVTGKQVRSEGLLQLSYQDALVFSFCNEFNWSFDRKLADRDARRTILQADKNLSCGIRILNAEAAKKMLVTFDRGNYWSTLKPSGRYGKVGAIRKLTRAISFCKKR